MTKYRKKRVPNHLQRGRNIILEHSKPIKQRHYPVSYVIEQKMHNQVRNLKYRKGSQNVFPDSLSRLYQDDESEFIEITVVRMAEQTSDQWYKNLFEKVSKNPADHPWYKIVGGRLYVYRLDPSIENLIKDQDAWKLLIPKEQRPTVLSECHE